MKKTLLLLTAFGFCFSLMAQNATRTWGLGAHFGTMQYAGDLGNEMFTTTDLHAAGGLSLNRYLTNSFDGLLMVSHGLLDYKGDTSGFKTFTTNFDLMARYKFNNGYLLKEDFPIAPFLQAGVATALTKAGHYANDFEMDFNFPMGGGIKFQVAEPLSVVLQTTYHYTLSDFYDADSRTQELDNTRDQFLTSTVGIVYNFNMPVDTDGDGIVDAADRCPEQPGSKEAGGCPDADKDGVADADDRCPNVAGVGENGGCPAIKNKDRAVMKAAIKGLLFETGSANIKEESNKVLDNVATVLKANPAYKLTIHGHTDNTGNADRNLELSKQRAQAAKEYLVAKGVDASRITAEGFGDAKPVAGNDTEEGRAKNRRVEFKIVF
ncbi:MAG: OmpA family protein [Salibacteraceae bacterium]